MTTPEDLAMEVRSPMLDRMDGLERIEMAYRAWAFHGPAGERDTSPDAVVLDDVEGLADARARWWALSTGERQVLATAATFHRLRTLDHDHVDRQLQEKIHDAANHAAWLLDPEPF